MANDKLDIVQDWKQVLKGKQADTFSSLMKMHIKLSAQKSKIEKEYKEVNTTLESLLAAKKLDGVQYEDWVARRVRGTSAAKLNPHKLIQAGVDVDTINLCTDPGREFTYFKAFPLKEGE